MAKHFGDVRGAEVVEAAIAASGIRAKVISYGAILRDLVIDTPNGPVRVVLGYDRLEDYLTRRGYVGAIVGRYGNRIAAARFRLDGKAYALEPNEGPNQLHGGPDGFSSRVWRLVEADAARVVFDLVSPDGDMGFPGRLVARVIYETPAPLTLRITTEAVCDQPTPVNIISHAYYNLDGGGDVRDHQLQIAAHRVTATDAALIPTGVWADVAGTAFDFRTRRRVGAGGIRYDINYALDHAGGGLFQGAELRAGRSGLAMELWTSEPGIQFYDGAGLGAPFGPHGGLCLEAQRFPDAPNHPAFPPAILRPGETSRQVVELRFRT